MLFFDQDQREAYHLLKRESNEERERVRNSNLEYSS